MTQEVFDNKNVQNLLSSIERFDEAEAVKLAAKIIQENISLEKTVDNMVKYIITTFNNMKIEGDIVGKDFFDIVEEDLSEEDRDQIKEMFRRVTGDDNLVDYIFSLKETEQLEDEKWKRQKAEIDKLLRRVEKTRKRTKKLLNS